MHVHSRRVSASAEPRCRILRLERLPLRPLTARNVLGHNAPKTTTANLARAARRKKRSILELDPGWMQAVSSSQAPIDPLTVIAGTPWWPAIARPDRHPNSSAGSGVTRSRSVWPRARSRPKPVIAIPRPWPGPACSVGWGAGRSQQWTPSGWCDGGTPRARSSDGREKSLTSGSTWTTWDVGWPSGGAASVWSSRRPGCMGSTGAGCEAASEPDRLAYHPGSVPLGRTDALVTRRQGGRRKRRLLSTG